MAKFIVVSSNASYVPKLTQMLYSCGIYNFFTLYEENSTVVLNVDFLYQTSKILNAEELNQDGITQIIFPDRVKYFAYKVIEHLDAKFAKSWMIYFLEVFCEKENLKLSVEQISGDSEVVAQNFSSLKRFLKYQMYLSYLLKYFDTYEKLMTYEESSYCILIPKPPRMSIKQAIIFAPFDRWTWMLLFVSLLLGMICWKVLHVSSFQFMFKINVF